jgi:hypothetical protein
VLETSVSDGHEHNITGKNAAVGHSAGGVGSTQFGGLGPSDGYKLLWSFGLPMYVAGDGVLLQSP